LPATAPTRAERKCGTIFANELLVRNGIRVHDQDEVASGAQDAIVQAIALPH
jgi:hypothetical protein